MEKLIVLTSCEVVGLSDVAAGERHDLELWKPLSRRLGKRQHVPQVADLTVDQVPALLRGTLRRPNRGRGRQNAISYRLVHLFTRAAGVGGKFLQVKTIEDFDLCAKPHDCLFRSVSFLSWLKMFFRYRCVNVAESKVPSFSHLYKSSCSCSEQLVFASRQLELLAQGNVWNRYPATINTFCLHTPS